MIANQRFIVEAPDSGRRLEHVIAGRFPGSSRSLAIAAIEKGAVTVNDRPAKKGLKLAAGDTVSVSELFEKDDCKALPDPAVKIDILLEDRAFLVVDKPAGMPVHPLKPHEMGTLVNGLLAKFPELSGIGGNPLFPAAVHRIDADTSGLILVARNEKAYSSFRGQFSEQKVLKKYIALVEGSMLSPTVLDGELVHSRAERHRMRVVSPNRRKIHGSMRAITECVPEQFYKDYTLLRVLIKTGVTHQIRCQLASAGHPIAGDRLYGNADQMFPRLFLHASELEFFHPDNEKKVSVKSELPEELSAILNMIR